MKIKIDLSLTELQLLADVVSGENITKEGLDQLGMRNNFLRWAILEQIKERSTKKLIQMQPGKYSFYLSEMIVFADYLAIMEIENTHLDAMRSALQYRINDKIYSKNVIGC